MLHAVARRATATTARRAASSSGPLKVGVVGAGAVGSYMGVRLAELGHDVRFLVMGSKPTPASIACKSWQGDALLENPRVARAPADLADAGEPLDWVLCGLKSTALEGGADEAFQNLLKPCVGPETRVQLLMNGLGAEEACAAALGGDPARVHGGLVYGGFGWADGAASHAGVPTAVHGGSLTDDAAQLDAAAALWRPVDGSAAPEGAVAYEAQPCLRLAQWAKLAWNVPFNGCTVLAGGADVGKLWGDAEGKATAVAIMREVIRAANADLEAHGAAPRLDEEALVEKLSAITDKMAEASYIPSTTNDFLAGRRMEVGAIFEEPVRRATAHGVDVPRLETLAGLLRVANDHIAAAGSWRDVT